MVTTVSYSPGIADRHPMQQLIRKGCTVLCCTSVDVSAPTTYNYQNNKNISFQLSGSL